MDGEFPEAGVDFEKANAARMYDYMLGGAHNFAVDREQVHRVLTHRPDMIRAATTNRAFLGRLVTWCVEAGFDQFLDLGSGVPTVGNVHQIAHAINPAVRVAYVDFEPVAVAHARDVLAGIDTVSVTHADLRTPPNVLAAPGVAGLLDFTRPVAVLAVAVLHFVLDDLDVVLRRYREVLAPGSALAITHGSDDLDDPGLAAEVRAGIEGYRGSATEATLRSRAELRDLLDGLRLVEPGLVDLTRWPAPQTDTPPIGMYAAVALLP